MATKKIAGPHKVRSYPPDQNANVDEIEARNRKSANLADVPNKATARTNLDVWSRAEGETKAGATTKANAARDAAIATSNAYTDAEVQAAVKAGAVKPRTDVNGGNWDATFAYDQLDLVFHEPTGASWYANAPTVPGDEPGVAATWTRYSDGLNLAAANAAYGAKANLPLNAADFPSLVNALTAAQSQGRDLSIPPGVWDLNAPFTTTVGNVRVTGAGRGRTTIRLTHVDACIIVNTSGFTLENLDMDAQGIATNCLRLLTANRGIFSYVRFRNALQDNVYAPPGTQNANVINWIACGFLNAGRDGWHRAEGRQSVNAHQFFGCDWTGSGRHGALIRGANHIVWGGNASGNAGWALKFGEPGDTSVTRGIAVFIPYMDGGSNVLGNISVVDAFGAEADPIYVHTRLLQDAVGDDPDGIKSVVISPRSLIRASRYEAALEYVLGQIDAAVADAFDRADSSTAMGNADTGQTWMPTYDSVWGISDNKARLVTNGSSSLRATLIDSGLTEQDVSADVTMTATGQAGLAVKAADEDTLWVAQLDSSNDRIQVHVWNGSSLTAKATLANVEINEGVYLLRVRTVRNALIVHLDGPEVLRYVMTAAEYNAVRDATKVGLRAAASASGNRWDNFAVRRSA